MRNYFPYFSEAIAFWNCYRLYGSRFLKLFLVELWKASLTMEIPWIKIHFAILSPIRVALAVAACEVDSSNIARINANLRRMGFTEEEGYELPTEI